jgi:hypothetical protein
MRACRIERRPARSSAFAISGGGLKTAIEPEIVWIKAGHGPQLLDDVDDEGLAGQADQALVAQAVEDTIDENGGEPDGIAKLLLGEG